MDERKLFQTDERGSFVNYDERTDLAWIRTKEGYKQNNQLMLENEDARRDIYG